MRRLPHYPDPEDHRVQRKWAKGFFVFYGVLMIVTAGFVFGNRLSNNPTHEMAWQAQAARNCRLLAALQDL